MYTKNARNKSQLFKKNYMSESFYTPDLPVIVQWYADFFRYAAYFFMLIVYWIIFF